MTFTPKPATGLPRLASRQGCAPPRAATGFPSCLNRRNSIVKNPRSFVGFAAALACTLTVATGAARADDDSLTYYAPSVTLTPYHLVLTAEGTCLSAPRWSSIVEPCDDTNAAQVFYLLKSDEDADFPWRNTAPGPRRSARIVVATLFDRTDGVVRSLETNARSELGDDFVSVDSDDANKAVTPDMLWYVDPAPLPASTWTHVADEGQSFPIGGRRTLRFGANGVFTHMTIEGSAGIDGIGGVGQCTGAFFGAPSGSGRTCDVQTPVNATTPYQVQFESAMYPNRCLTRVAILKDFHETVADDCNSVQPGYPTVWTLVPVPYLQYP